MFKQLNFNLKESSQNFIFSKKRLLSFIFLFFQLLAIGYIIKQFEIAIDFNLIKLFPVILFGFAVHFWTPYRYKLPLFSLIGFFLEPYGITNI